MFVKVYEYHVKEDKEALFLDIQEQVVAIYQKHVSCEVMFLKSMSHKTMWAEISTYDSEDMYRQGIQRINEEREIHSLFKRFEACLASDETVIREQNYIRKL